VTRFVNRFVISDHHLGHTNSWEKFKLEDGSPLRPFSSNEEMNETMIERHNAKVKEQDTVYFLGDVVINKKYLELVKRMNGRKILVRGNHDIFGDELYYDAGFEQIHGVRVFVDKFILSHIPLHPDCVTERFRVNVHGHLHANQVMSWQIIDEDPVYKPDPRYLCVCVEQTNFTPLHFDEVEKLIQQRWKDAEYEGPDKAWGNGSGPN
jgi:calcineurin-like phosphoesterase family protein